MGLKPSISICCLALACTAPVKTLQTGRSSPPPPRPPCDTTIAGAPSDFTNVIGAQVDPPEECKGAFYLRVHGRGTRTIQMGRAGQTNGCHQPPAEGAPAEACPVLFADAFGRAVAERMAGRGVQLTGLGMGACGKIDSMDVDTWRYSVSVASWKDVDAAVASVQEELDRWGAGSSFGVTVRPVLCAVPL